jgi:uncharacterized protein (DUF58 family)
MSRQKGVSLEFADYREYAAGDDLRHLDWNILARLDRPTIRTYQDEDDLAVYLLLDASASMHFGSPTKFSFAQKLAAALGFIGLCGQDQVTPIIIGHGAGRTLRGRIGLNKLERWASTASANSLSGLADGIKSFVRSSAARPGLVICITDALDEEAASTVRSVGGRGHEILLIQVLSDFDIDPEIDGDLRLIDSESGPTVDITANAETIASYKQNLARHCRNVEQAVSIVGGRYVRAESSASALDFVTHNIRSTGAVD